VEDTTAVVFMEVLYRDLAAGATVGQGYEAANAAMEAKYGPEWCGDPSAYLHHPKGKGPPMPHEGYDQACEHCNPPVRGIPILLGDPETGHFGGSSEPRDGAAAKPPTPSNSSPREMDRLLAEPVDVVISYSTRSMGSERGGEEFMKRLCDRIREKGYTTFDGTEVPPSGNWRLWWGTKALNARVVLPLLSEPYFRSDACKAELTLAKNQGKQLLPILQEAWPRGTVPVDCQMMLQDSNRIPSSGNFDFSRDSERLFETLDHMLGAGTLAGLRSHNSNLVVEVTPQPRGSSSQPTSGNNSNNNNNNPEGHGGGEALLGGDELC